MQTDFLSGASMLAPLLYGLLFFLIAWVARKKTLMLTIAVLSILEIVRNELYPHLVVTSTHPLIALGLAKLNIHLGAPSQQFPLVANTVMALLMLCLASAIKLYVRIQQGETEKQLHRREIQGGGLCHRDRAAV